jgi:cytochrome c-type biogenesis protein CcmH/NrfF
MAPAIQQDHVLARADGRGVTLLWALPAIVLLVPVFALSLVGRRR